jgi:hypothetical protein
VRVRTIELRILGVALAGLWSAAFALVLTGYRPGGPVDIAVGLAAIGPIIVALVAVAWPPVARGDRAFAAIAWLGLGAVLLLLPSLAGIATQLAGRGPQTLLPSLEAAYPWLLALLATGLFAGLGVARRRLGETALRRRRLRLGAALGFAFTVLAGAVFTVAAVANELALGDRPSVSSRFGPTDPGVEPPRCSDPLSVGTTARLELRMDDTVDGRRTGQVVIDGIRNGADVRWTGFAATRVTLGTHGVARIGDRGWVLQPGIAWTAVPLDVVAGTDLDRQLVTIALTPGNRAVAEDRGLAYVEGARARHCRITIDGTTLRLALPSINLLVGASDLSIWRGDLDFWVFLDGQLGQADGRLTGPAIGIEEDALIAELRFRITAVDRGLPISVLPPARR